MVASTKELKYRIGADFGEVRREAAATGDATKKFQRELDALEKKQRAHRKSIEELGRGFLTFGAVLTAGLGMAAKAAIDWETAFTGVRKTVDGSDAEIASLGNELRNLARTLPATHEEIAAVAEAAGQLGIKRQDIAGFTKVMVDLGETTNLSAEEAATALAKFSNIMGVSAKDVDRLGATLVALGNDGASTEKDIIDMGLRIAGAGHQIGLTADQVLALASAMSSVGIEAEAGGTAISTVMVRMASVVNAGGAELDAFAKVAGESAGVFAAKFKTDASGALIEFIQGLGRMQKSGQDVFGTLDTLSLADVRVRDTLLRAAGASDLFTKSLQVGARGWAENTALTDEANKRYETTASKIRVAGNQIKDALIDVGATVIPVVSSITQGASDLTRAFQNLPGPLKEIVTWVGLAAAGITVIGGVGAIAAPKIMNFRDKMSALVESGGAVSKTLGRFGTFITGPWGAALGLGVTLLGAFGIASGSAQRHQEDLANAGKSVAQSIREQNGALNDSVRKAAAKAAEDNHLLSSAKNLGIQLTTVTDAILGQGNAYEELKTRLKGIVDAGTERTNAGKSGTITRYSDEAQAAMELQKNLDGLVAGKNAELNATQNVDAASKDSTRSTLDLGAATALTKKEYEEAATALDDMVKSLGELNQTTLSARDAERGYVEQLGETHEVAKRNGQTLDINTKKGRENAEALDAQAKAALTLAEAVGREAEQHGGAAEGAAALKASLEASRPALIQAATDMGMGAEEALAFANEVLAIPAITGPLVVTPGSKEAVAELQRVREKVEGIPPDKKVNVGVLSDAAKTELQTLGYKIQTLPNGQVVVFGNTAPAQNELDNYIRRNNGKRLTLYVDTVGGQRRVKDIEIYGAQGNIVSFASGGMYEDHAPQIVRASAGAFRVWAEPETGRESYIPWAWDRRTRATSILRSTARGFGYDLVPRSQLAGRFGPTGATTTGTQPTARIEFRSDGSRLGDVLVEIVRKAVRVQGGNVQSVLGQ